jgi:SPOR domain
LYLFSHNQIFNMAFFKLISFSFFINMFVCFNINAQTNNITIKEEQIAFEVIKDARLDALDKRPELIAAAIAAKEKAEQPKENTTVFSEIKVGKKVVTGSIISKDGFRILIYNGNDKTKALQLKNLFARNFPGIHSYMNYVTPNFKIKVGDFEDKKEANNFLKKIGIAFPGAFLVPDVVTVKNILVQ